MVLEVVEQRRVKDEALRKYKHAQMLMRHLESDLSRWQSTNKNVMQAYQVAGAVGH